MMADEQRALIRYRLELAAQTLEDARRLTDTGAVPHSIVNRAYYAMFYSVLALANLKGFVPRKHYSAIAFFDREFVRTGIFSKDLSSSLHNVFDQRLDCDYADFADPTKEEAATALEHASLFVDSVTDYLRGPLEPPKSE
jgi:uncharacterized protein (UPF0332 family)